MAEWSIAAVLKTVEGHTSGGSNPSLSAKYLSSRLIISDNQTAIFYATIKNTYNFDLCHNYLIFDRISSGDWCIWLKATIFFPRSFIEPPMK